MSPVPSAGDFFDVSPVWGQRDPRKPSGVPMPRLWSGSAIRSDLQPLSRTTVDLTEPMHPYVRNRLGAEKPGE